MRKTDRSERAESVGQVTVEDVGTGVDQRQVIHMPSEENEPSLDLVRLTGRGDLEIRVEDEVLGRYVEFRRPRDIRAVVDRLRSEDKNFNPLAVRGESPRTGGRPATKYFFTEIEAVFVIMACGTEKAHELRWSFAKKIVRARHETSAPQVSPVVTVQIRALRRALKRYRTEFGERFMDLARQNQNLQGQIIKLQDAADSGIIRKAVAQSVINAGIRAYARKMATLEPENSFMSHCTTAHQDLREALEYPASFGSDWSFLPKGKLGTAERIINRWNRKADRRLKARDKAKSQKAKSKQAEFSFN